MIVLGIDPGTTRIGFGIVEKQGGGFRALTSGLFASPQDPFLLEKELLALLKKYNPNAVAIEKVFFGKNQKTALAVSEMRGVIKFIVQKQKILILEYTPLEIKQSVTGYGRAEKQQLEKLTLKILNVPKKPRYDDESDALAIALSGALSYPMYIKTRNLS